MKKLFISIKLYFKNYYTRTKIKAFFNNHLYSVFAITLGIGTTLIVILALLQYLFNIQIF